LIVLQLAEMYTVQQHETRKASDAGDATEPSTASPVNDRQRRQNLDKYTQDTDVLDNG